MNPSDSVLCKLAGAPLEFIMDHLFVPDVQLRLVIFVYYFCDVFEFWSHSSGSCLAPARALR